MESHTAPTPTFAPGEAHSHFAKTFLDLTDTQSAFDQGKQAFTQHQYDQAINLYTQALTTLQTHVISIILLHRATAYEMSNQFDKAKQDSQTAMADAEPTCPDAYLSYGSACYFTGYGRKALATYREGIANVPQDIPQHAMLVRKHGQLEKEIDQRNQSIVRILPFEVTHNILSRVSMIDRMQFAQTCRFWYRWLMYEYAEMWYEIDGKDLHKPINSTVDWIPQQKVRKVILDLIHSPTIRHDWRACDDDDEKSSTRRYLANNAHISNSRGLGLPCGSDVVLNTMQKWDCVETLDISNYEDEQLCIALESNKNTLKRLTVHPNLSAREPPILQSLADAVRISQKLQYLTMEGDFNVSFGRDGSVPTFSTTSQTRFTTALEPLSTLPLIQLRLSNEIPVDLLAQLLTRCPKLAVLSLIDWSGQSLAQVLQLIHANCPQLRTFVYGERYQAIPDSTTLSYPDDPTPGLRTISISPLRADNRTETFKELENLFRRNRASLSNLCIGGTLLGAYKCRILKLAADQGFSHLQTLFIWYNEHAELDEKRLCALLKACPSLQSVSLRCQIPPSHQTLLETLGGIPELKHLDIEMTWKGIAVIEENAYLDSWKCGMKSLFREAKGLHTFVFGTVQYAPEKLEAAMMTTIAKLVSKRSVRKLDLHRLNLRTVEGFNALLKGLKDSQVRELIVGTAIEKRPWQSIDFKRVASIQHIEFLKICKRGAYFKAKDIEVILDAHESPQTLVVWFDSDHVYMNGCKFTDDNGQDEDDPVERYHIQVERKGLELFNRYLFSSSSSSESSDS